MFWLNSPLPICLDVSVHMLSFECLFHSKMVMEGNPIMGTSDCLSNLFLDPIFGSTKDWTVPVACRAVLRFYSMKFHLDLTATFVAAPWTERLLGTGAVLDERKTCCCCCCCCCCGCGCRCRRRRRRRHRRRRRRCCCKCSMGIAKRTIDYENILRMSSCSCIYITYWHHEWVNQIVTSGTYWHRPNPELGWPMHQ